MVVFQRCPTVHGPQESAAKSRSAAPADKPPRLLPQLPSTATIPISTLNFQELPDHYGGGGGGGEGLDSPAGGDTRSCQTAADILEQRWSTSSERRTPPPLMEAN